MIDYPHIYKPMDHFQKKLDQIRVSDPVGYEHVQKVIGRLLTDPDVADGKMHGIYQGRFKKYVGRREYRIIYHWCRLCRKENKRQEKVCRDCDSIPDNSVIFFDIYHKKDKKKFKHAV
ncbi:MAG: toxin [Pseudomonadota bacterium]